MKKKKEIFFNISVGHNSSIAPGDGMTYVDVVSCISPENKEGMAIGDIAASGMKKRVKFPVTVEKSYSSLALNLRFSLPEEMINDLLDIK